MVTTPQGEETKLDSATLEWAIVQCEHEQQRWSDQTGLPAERCADRLRKALPSLPIAPETEESSVNRMMREGSDRMARRLGGEFVPKAAPGCMSEQEPDGPATVFHPIAPDHVLDILEKLESYCHGLEAVAGRNRPAEISSLFFPLSAAPQPPSSGEGLSDEQLAALREWEDQAEHAVMPPDRRETLKTVLALARNAVPPSSGEEEAVARALEDVKAKIYAERLGVDRPDWNAAIWRCCETIDRTLSPKANGDDHG